MDTSIRVADRRRASGVDCGEAWEHGLWQRWRQRVRMRAELRAMDRRALADIGMDPEAARQEVRKFFWQC